MNKNLLVTTPIFYVNASPHIGHLYTILLADAIAKDKSMAGFNVKLMTGTDEHGIKIQKKAKSMGISPKELCDINSQKFRDLCHISEVQPDTFIRTTDEMHKKTVTDLWNKLINAKTNLNSKYYMI